MHVFDSFKMVKRFTNLWVFLALLAALWGIEQEIFGFMQFEWDYIYAKEGRFDLLFQWGRYRRFSFLSDVANFGMTMAFSGLFCMVFAVNYGKRINKIYYIISFLLMIMAMNYSGTRTATAMFALGIAFYIILTINNWKSMLVACLAVIAFMAIMYGPFYGSRFNRIRSTFSPSDDPSMQVRDRNRVYIQPYILSHPIGGGINTSDLNGLRYSPSHPLAGFITDSGYLTVAVEKGLIGLVLLVGFYFLIMKVGIESYFKVRSKEIRTYYAAYITAFLSITFGNFPQSSMDQKPLVLIILAIFALVIKMKDFDDERYEIEQNTPKSLQ